jgi:hypothetical protein
MDDASVAVEEFDVPHAVRHQDPQGHPGHGSVRGIETDGHIGLAAGRDGDPGGDGDPERHVD